MKYPSIETYWLLVVQQFFSTAHDIYRPFTVYSDLLLPLTPLPRLYSYKKIRQIYIICFPFTILPFLLPFHIFSSSCVLSQRSVCLALVAKALLRNQFWSFLQLGCLGKHTVCCPVVCDICLLHSSVWALKRACMYIPGTAHCSNW